MFRETHIHVRSIDTDLEVSGEKLNWVDTIIGWCQQLGRGKEPNHLTSPVKENLGERDWWADWDGTETDEDQEQLGDNSHGKVTHPTKNATCSETGGIQL
jgi:hypothetical protein